MYVYDKLFSEHHHTVAQLLLTADDLRNEQRYINFENTINRLLEFGVIPVINENDTVTTDEIVIGDNDTLAAIVAQSVQADLLILLSDIDGLYTADPHKDPSAVLVERVSKIDDQILALAGVSSTTLGTGGMVTKLHAAEICLGCGCDMVIANGNRPENLYDILDGKSVGTRFSEKSL
jgi:glutamate 5-kinase